MTESLAIAEALPLPSAVAGQSKFKSDTKWSSCTVEHVKWVHDSPEEFAGYEARYLYDAQAICEVLDVAAQAVLAAQDDASRTAAANRLQTMKDVLKGCVLVANGQDLPALESPVKGRVLTSGEVAASLAITSAIHRIEKGAPQTALAPLKEAAQVLRNISNPPLAT